MAKHKTAKSNQPLTTAQRLGSLRKSARDVMRKDKGLNGDLDRLPMLTWVMFLKFLDDHGQVREGRAKMQREKYRSAAATALSAPPDPPLLLCALCALCGELPRS